VNRSRLAPIGAALVALALAVPAQAAPHAAANRVPPLRPVTQPKYEALPPESALIPTGGGQVFVSFIRPSVPARVRVPVILTLTPYSIGGASADDGVAGFYVPRGYARAVADVPGTGNSGGCWDYGGRLERAAGYELVEWLGTQPWSNGKVGMIGGSYDGTTANMVASDNAPHLATIVPEVAIGQWYGYAYHDGVRYFVMDPGQRQGAVIDEQGFDTPVTFEVSFGLAPPVNVTDAYVAGRVQERLCPDQKALHTERAYAPDSDFDEFWRDRDYVAGVRNLARRDGQEIPVLVVGGWQDYNVKHSESTRWYEAIPADDPRTRRDEGVPQKMLVMDQVSHGLPVSKGIPFDDLLHAWFDHYLLGLRTNVERQPGSLSVTQDGVLHRDSVWPPRGTADASLFLGPAGTLTPRAVQQRGSLGSFQDDVPMTESMALAAKGGPAMLWFESAPLKRSVRIAGTPRLNLLATSNVISTHYTPVLFDLGAPVNPKAAQCDFVPAQDACVISRGFLNARYRRGVRTGEDLVADEYYWAPIRFIDNDWVIPAGHRIGLAVMSSNVWWAMPDPRRSTNAIFTHPDARTALVLPVVGGPAAARAAGL
jgi:X-Pro dipeptidyl-peptidase